MNINIMNITFFVHPVEHTNEPIVLFCFSNHYYMLYRVSQKKLTALKCKLVAPNPIGTKHIK